MALNRIIFTLKFQKEISEKTPSFLQEAIYLAHLLLCASATQLRRIPFFTSRLARKKFVRLNIIVVNYIIIVIVINSAVTRDKNWKGVSVEIIQES